MLSVRLPKLLEHELNLYCTSHYMSKSEVVQAALTVYMASNSIASPTKQLHEPGLSFLSLDDPILQFIGIAKEGPSTDEWMAITRGER